MIKCNDSLLPIKVLEYKSKIKTNIKINKEYRLLKINFPLRNVKILPGQFFHLLCPSINDISPYLRRPMSIYNFDYDANEVEFLYKIHGSGTHTLSKLKKNDYLNVLGPLGNSFTISREWKNILIVARGVGLATLLPVAKIASSKKINVIAILSARSPDLIMSREMFNQFGAVTRIITDSEGNSSVSDLENLIKMLMKRNNIDCFFTCGSNRILNLLKKICLEHKIKGQIALEQQMACGLGMCYCCVREFEVKYKKIYKRVCKEGPVFNIVETKPW